MSDDRTSADDMPRRTLANPARLRASTAYPGGQIVRAPRRLEHLPEEAAAQPKQVSQGIDPC
jgi:hypothetical protein